MQVNSFFSDVSPKCICYIRVSSFSKSLYRGDLNQVMGLLNTIEGIEVLSHVKNGVVKKSMTVLRSPHIDKKSREQFGRTTYNFFVVVRLSNLNDYSKLESTLRSYSGRGLSIRLLSRFMF